MGRKFSRREFLRLGGAGVAGAALLGGAACTGGAGSLVRREAPEDAMNIILVIVDSLRKDAVGAYGGDRIRTPSIDALTGDSLRFDRFFPESVPTIPARRSIHTGLRSFPFRNWEYEPGDVRVYGWEPIPDGQVTISEVLGDAGFETAIVTDTRHQFEPHMNFMERFHIRRKIEGQEWSEYRPARQADEERVQRYLLDAYRGTHVESKIRQYVANTEGRETEEDWFAPQVFIQAMEVLEELKESRPFFLTVDVFDPHEPWDPPLKYVYLYDDPDYDGIEPITVKYGDAGYLDERLLQRARALYAGETTMMDRWFGEFLNKVDELGLFEETLLIFVSDHGLQLGDYGVVGKVSSRLFPDLMDIPMLIRHPEGKGRGQTTDYFSAFHDIPATIADMLGFEPADQPLDGVSLAPLLEGQRPAAERPYMVSGYDRFVWSRDDRYVYMSENRGENPSLYDLREDPEQRRDISGEKPEVAREIFDRIVEEAGGGPLPRYDI
jgi:arylsulfatase A-like enzyme